MRTLAIDPGSSGGFAWTEGQYIVETCKMPATEGDVLDKLRELRSTHPDWTAYVEDQVGCFGGQGATGASMFKFGRGFGFLLGSLQALGFRVELVRPMKWQKRFALGTKAGAGGTTPWKNKLKQRAQQLYPTLTVTLNTADALLLLEYSKSSQ